MDRLYGCKGNDTVSANEAPTGQSLTREVIDCGAGKDEAWFDNGLDVVKNCEVKHPY